MATIEQIKMWNTLSSTKLKSWLHDPKFTKAERKAVRIILDSRKIKVG